MRYPEHLLKLIAHFRKLPGVGGKTAERFAFQILTWNQEKLSEMAEALATAKEKLQSCSDCGALMGETACEFCAPHRHTDVLCVVAYPKDVFLIEETRSFKGLYHVLGNLLSPLNQMRLDQGQIDQLKKRIERHHVKEVILALDATLEGDATSLFLKRELEALHIPTSRLALGLPMGSSLDLIDGGTLARALSDRRSY